MALFLDAPVPLEDTISFTQQVPLPSNNRLTQLFPTRTFSTDEIDTSIITQTNRAAKFRNWDGNFWVSPRDTGKITRQRMIPLGGQLGVGEYERRQLEFARYGGTVQSILTDAIYNDLENLTRYALNRVELAWGDVLADGVLTINENGVQQQVDYGIPANQKVTAGTLWSTTATSTPLTDLIAWYDVYVATNGIGPGRFLTSLATVRNLQKNVSLINAIKGANTGVTNAVLPANKFMFLPDDLGTLGFTAWGTPTTVMELNANNIQVQQAAGLIGIIVREDQPPFQKRTFVDGVVLPVLADPRKILVATVA